MSSSIQLRRSRGLELALPRSRARDRRPCRFAERGGDALRTPAPRARVELERLDADSAVLRLRGELDVASLPALDRALQRVERRQLTSLLADTTDVGFVDLSVIGWLVGTHARLDALGGGLLVVHPPDCLLRILDVLDVDLPVLS